MKFKEFAKWCNKRACDGYWGMKEAVICSEIASYMYSIPFWKREKVWKKYPYRDVAETIVEEINNKINELC